MIQSIKTRNHIIIAHWFTLVTISLQPLVPIWALPMMPCSMWESTFPKPIEKDERCQSFLFFFFFSWKNLCLRVEWEEWWNEIGLVGGIRWRRSQIFYFWVFFFYVMVFYLFQEGHMMVNCKFPLKNLRDRMEITKIVNVLGF